MMLVFLLASLFINRNIASTSCDREGMEDTICSLCAQRKDAGLWSRVEDLETRVASLRRNIAFYTYMSKSVKISSLSANKILVYDVVELNLGKGYDVITGKFVTPDSGLYAFHVTSVSFDSSWSTVKLMLDGVVKNVGFSDSGNHNDRASSSTFTILSLEKNQTVYTQVGVYGGSILESNEHSRLSFSGYKIG
ncbi:uncharacterized protein LOC125670145 isoform X1 [Ostrea edulis]|uniref:uncharacterized protein LOC125670145 isoform X1 n=1 Tax=Ostrea edulis TaxID=37623 RepID=UPI0024AFCFFA|nr:uncharacterized protein LOC125670145 isoform X1 [Ostrea edulis]